MNTRLTRGLTVLLWAIALTVVATELLTQGLALLLQLLAPPSPDPSTLPVVVHPLAAAPRPSPGVAPPALDSLSVVALRTIARDRLGPSTRIEGRRIAQARRQALLAALGG